MRCSVDRVARHTQDRWAAGGYVSGVRSDSRGLWRGRRPRAAQRRSRTRAGCAERDPRHAQRRGRAGSVTIDRRRAGRVRRGAGARSTRSCTTSTARPRTVARYLLTLDAINFGSGWFPTLRKRPGPLRLRDDRAALRRALPRARAVDQRAAARARPPRRSPPSSASRADHELMALYAQALRALGRWLGERTVLEAIAAAGGSAEALAAALAAAMAMFARPRLLQARPDRARRTSRSPASPPSPTSTA